MKWRSSEYSVALFKQLEFLLPEDFDYQTYIDLHPDLIAAEIDNEQKAKEHYLFFGRKEGRAYKILSYEYSVDDTDSYEIWNNDNNNIMVFSPTAPDYDCSSGGNRLYELLKILKLLQYNVYFFCNTIIDLKYKKAVKDLGINIYYPNIDDGIYMDKYIEDLKVSNVYFDNVIFCWYDIGNQYIDIVKQYYPNIKIIADSVDVHWIREQRGKDNGELSISQMSLDHRQNIEMQVYRKSNVVLAITSEDKRHIEQELGDKINTKILSNIHHKQFGPLGPNIFFIGNYNHYPNIQGAIESIKIFDVFSRSQTYFNLKQKPKLLIVGPNIDNRVLSHIHTDNIEVCGKIEDLESLYSQSCLCLSPLYWGAGIKGKICDSAMRGIPILTTPIGNEGINFINNQHAMIGNTTEDMVEHMINFFSMSYEQKIELGRRGQEYIENIVGLKAAVETIQSVLEEKHIVISIVAYSQTEKLYRCLETIFDKAKYSNFTVVVTDNSSDSTIYETIKPFAIRHNFIYKKNVSNRYFIEPNNDVMFDPKYLNSDVVLVNDDIEILSDGWLNYLYSSAYSEPKIGAVGGKTLYPNYTIAEAGAELYSDGTGKNLYRHYPNDEPLANIRKSVGYCSGCLLYLKRSVIDEIGVFDTDLEKMYYEDSEWQYRAHTKGFKTIYEPRCVAIHHEGSSSGTDINKGTKKYQAINQKIFVKKYKNLNIEQYN